jgi:aminoglycoside phosphotransferase (APT) family kinase protein
MYRAEADPQDWRTIAALLDAAGLALDLSEPPRQFAGGVANLNYQVRVNGQPAVFRRPPAGSLAHGASDMGREARVLRALDGVFPLAPRLLHACLEDSPIGVPFLLLEWRPGVAVGGALPAGMRAADADWLIPALAEALAALHRLPADLSLGKPEGFAARQVRGWERRAAAAFGAQAPPALVPLLERLSATLPADPPPAILHMDAKLDNLLIDPATRRATAMIDWDMGTLGSPAFDLAVILSYWIEAGDPAEAHALAALPSLAPGWPDKGAMIHAYAQAAGAIPPDLGWHLALARLRLATAWMQLFRLWQAGSLTDPRYAGFQDIAHAILALALDRFGELR